MVEADIHFRLLHTSILDIYKVFELLVCCLKVIWLHPHTVTLAKLAVMVETDIHLRLRPLHTYILDIYKVFEPLVCCLKAIWLQ